MDTIRKYVSRFIKEDEGAELIQFAIVVGLAALLAGAVRAIYLVAESKVDDAKELIEAIEVKTS